MDKVDEMAKKRISDEEAKNLIDEKERLKVIPEFQSMFWIFDALRAGQKEKGFLGMSDCEALLQCEKDLFSSLKQLIDHEANPTGVDNFQSKNPILAGEACFYAFGATKAMLEALQETGYFSVEDSVVALSHVKSLNKLIVEKVDPEFKKEHLESSIKDKKKEMKNKRTGKNSTKAGKRR